MTSSFDLTTEGQAVGVFRRLSGRVAVAAAFLVGCAAALIIAFWTMAGSASAAPLVSSSSALTCPVGSTSANAPVISSLAELPVVGSVVNSLTSTVSNLLGVQSQSSPTAQMTGVTCAHQPLVIGTPELNGVPVTSTPPVVSPGSAVTITVPVTNEASTTLSNVAVSSPQGNASVPVTSLTPGQSTTVTFSGTAGSGTEQITITLKGIDPQGAAVTMTVTITYDGTSSQTSYGSANETNAAASSSSTSIPSASSDGTPVVSGTDPSTGSAPISSAGSAAPSVLGATLSAHGVASLVEHWLATVGVHQW